jgi:hypothetical protein
MFFIFDANITEQQTSTANFNDVVFVLSDCTLFLGWFRLSVAISHQKPALFGIASLTDMQAHTDDTVTGAHAHRRTQAFAPRQYTMTQ